MSQGIAFPTKCKRWRMGEVTWSVHHNIPALDALGLGANKNFGYVSHEELPRMCRLSLKKTTNAGPLADCGVG